MITKKKFERQSKTKNKTKTKKLQIQQIYPIIKLQIILKIIVIILDQKLQKCHNQFKIL